MRPPRSRLTIRLLLVLIAILALLLRAVQWAHDRYLGPTLVKTYYVGDLMRPHGPINVPFSMGEVSEQAALLKSSVAPDAWWLGTGSVTPFRRNASLIVRHTRAGHLQVADWLRRRRERLDPATGGP